MTATGLSDLGDRLNLLVCLKESAYAQRSDQRALATAEIFAPTTCQTPSVCLATQPRRRNTRVLFFFFFFIVCV